MSGRIQLPVRAAVVTVRKVLFLCWCTPQQGTGSAYVPQTPAERWWHARARREHTLRHVVAQEGALHDLAEVCAVHAVHGGWPAGVMTAHWTYQ